MSVKLGTSLFRKFPVLEFWHGLALSPQGGCGWVQVHVSTFQCGSKNVVSTDLLIWRLNFEFNSHQFSYWQDSFFLGQLQHSRSCRPPAQMRDKSQFRWLCLEALVGSFLDLALLTFMFGCITKESTEIQLQLNRSFKPCNVFGIALRFDNQTRSSLRFKWSS